MNPLVEMASGSVCSSDLPTGTALLSSKLSQQKNCCGSIVNKVAYWEARNRMKTENETLIREFILVGLSNDRRIQILLFVIIFMVYLLTMVGNLMIIGLVQSDSRLHTPMYYFLTHLSGLEIIYVTSTMPQMLVHLLSGNGAISFIRCAAQMYIAMCLGSVECFLLAAMAYDRYMAICSPLGYALAMGRWRQTQLAAASWTGGFLLASINVSVGMKRPSFAGEEDVNVTLRHEPMVGAENLTSVTEFILMGLTNHRKTQILLFVIILIIYVLTVVENLLIIMLVRTDSRLHTPMYFFLTQLSSVELCFVTSTMPQMLAYLQSGNGAISFNRCVTQMYIGASMGGVECILLAVMAYDRYLAICHPLLYTIIMGQWRQLQLAIFAWVGGFFIAAINVGFTLRHPFCGPNRINHFCCELPMLLKLTCADTHITEAIIFATSVVVLVGPLSVILTSYGFILSSVLRVRSTTSQHKAFSTCTSHLVVVTMFYGTAISMYLRPQTGTSPNENKETSVFYIVVTPLLNPIIYTLRNKDIHGAVAKILQRRVLEHKN
ncbi:olfactory receptor 2G3-like [Tiliqua scincoides]|uniref:olfactory receptor 2G3-like n=1 Tax=Tiliqua scincoides TaxID=71010 RepID=UPI003463015D